MKRVIAPLAVLVVLTALVFTTSPATLTITQKFVDLPAEQEIAISGIFIMLVAVLFDLAVAKFPWLSFFNQYREVWALALSTLFVTWLQNVLPTGLEDISIKFVAVLIAVALYLLAKVTVPALRREVI